MLSNNPMTVQSRGRLYTDSRERRQFVTNDNEYGHGTEVMVHIELVERGHDWGMYTESIGFPTTLQSDGAIQIPAKAREKVGLSEGDDVRVMIKSFEDD